MFEVFNRLPEGLQGVIYTFIGCVMLLYALGIVQKGITTIVILFALYLILVGCVRLGLDQRLKRIIRGRSDR